MKPRTKTIFKGTLAGIGVLVIMAAIIVAAYAAFPGKISETPFQNQLTTAGLKTRQA